MENTIADHQWVLELLHGVLPEHTTQFLRDHILNPQTPFQIIRRELSLRLGQAYNAMLPVLQPLFDRAIQALSDSPDIVVLGFVIAIFVVVLQIIFFIQRTIRYFTRLAFKLMGYGFIVLLLAFAWQRGPEATARDVVSVVAKIVGYGAVVRDIWWTEYQKYDAQTRGQKIPGYGEGRRAGL